MGTPRATYIILWKFQAKKGREAEFEHAYGPQGEWVQFFRKGKGYIKTELYHDNDDSYLTIDEWTSQEAYEKFKLDFSSEYHMLDKKFEELTEEEIHIGSTTRALP